MKKITSRFWRPHARSTASVHDTGRVRITVFLCAATIAVGVSDRPAQAFEADRTVAGILEQAALRSQLHRRLMGRFAHPLGLFEPLRLDLNNVSDVGPPAATPRGTRGRSLYGRLSQLNPAEGYAPEWQADGTQVYPLARLHALGWLTAGGAAEHNPTSRIRHHFFDPKTGLGLVRPVGQTAAEASAFALHTGLSSMRQVMTGTALDGTGRAAPDWIVASENDLGLPTFLAAYERAVLAPQPAVRDAALAEALLCAGGMMSVLSQMADPAYVRGDLATVLGGDGAARVAQRFGRAGVPALPRSEAAPPRRLRDLFADGEGGGLAESTARRCKPAWRCYSTDATTQLSDAAQGARRLLDYLFRSELRLTLQGGALHVIVDDGAIGSGTLTILGEGSDGVRTALTTVATPPTLVGGEVTQIALADSQMAGLSRLVVLFVGRDRQNEPLATSAHLLLGPVKAAAATP